MNKFIDKNDYIGLIQAEPEPKTYFNVDRVKRFVSDWSTFES